MKYVISDQKEVVLGNDYHQDLARGMYGKVVRAGQYKIHDGKYEVFGESYGFGIKAQPSDAELLNNMQIITEGHKNANGHMLTLGKVKMDAWLRVNP